MTWLDERKEYIANLLAETSRQVTTLHLSIDEAHDLRAQSQQSRESMETLRTNVAADIKTRYARPS